MKRNLIVSIICVIICFLLLIGAIVLNIMEQEEYSAYAAMGSTAVAFISVMFGINSWKDK